MLFTSQLPIRAISRGAGLPDPVAALQTGSTAQTDLQPAPLDPTWILSGNPTARSLSLGKAEDGKFSFGLWDCTDGQFNFFYRSDELIHILEGAATIRAAWMELHLGPGDVAFFPRGSTAHWTVHGYVRKLAIFRSEQPTLATRMARKVKRVWRGLSSFSQNLRLPGTGSALPQFSAHKE